MDIYYKNLLEHYNHKYLLEEYNNRLYDMSEYYCNHFIDWETESLIQQGYDWNMINKRLS